MKNFWNTDHQHSADSLPLGPQYESYEPNPLPRHEESQYDSRDASTTLRAHPMHAPSSSGSSDSSRLSSFTQASPTRSAGPPLGLAEQHGPSKVPFLPGHRHSDAYTRSAQAHPDSPRMEGPPASPDSVNRGLKPMSFNHAAITDDAPAVRRADPVHARSSPSRASLTPPMGSPSPASSPASYGSHPVAHSDLGAQPGTPTVNAYKSSQGTHAGPPQPESPPAPLNTLPVIPRYRYGLVAAVSAHAHLLRIRQQIEKLLDSHGIRTPEWDVQAGFRTKNSKDGEKVELPSTLLQEIVITFADRASVKGKLPKFSDQLKALIAPFYGTVQYRDSHKTIDLQTQSDGIADTNCSRDLLVGGCSGSRGESLFDVEEHDSSEPQTAPSVKLSVINFANDQDPDNHFATSAAFALEKGDRPGQISVKFSELKFAGPQTSYSLQSSFARVIFDQPSTFGEIFPEEMFEIDAAAQYKHNTQKTIGKEVQRSAEVEVGMDPKVTVGGAQVDRKEDVKAEETMRNCWEIHHSEDETSKTIRYFSMRPEFKGRMTFPEAFRPRMESAPSFKSSLAQTVTVRVWSVWTLAPALDQREEGFLKRLWHRIAGKTKLVDGKARTYTNVVHCIEAIVPLCFVGAARKIVVREDILDQLLDGAVSTVSN